MQKTKEQLSVFSIGAITYPLLEILWKRGTHWSMAVAGGVCFCTLYNIYNNFKRLTFLQRGLISSAVITTVEFTIGVIVNIWQKWQVWDYSAFKFNFLGQICLAYSTLWFLFSLPINFIAKRLKNYFVSLPVNKEHSFKQIEFNVTD